MLSFIDKGNGSVVVFIHGYCEWKGYWQSAIDVFSSKYRCIVPDLPGHGESASIANVSIEAMAEQVQHILVSANINRVTLVGHSLGGYVCLAFAERYPEMVTGLCLFHSTAYADSEEKKQQRNKTIVYLKENGTEAFIRPFVPPLFYPANREKCKAAIDKLIEEGLKTKPEVIADTAAAMRDRPDRTHVLTEAKYPVLFIIGKNDASVKPEDSLAQSNLPKESYVLLLGDTAHQGLFEKEKETLDMIGYFLSITNKKALL